MPTIQDMIEWNGDTAVLPDDAQVECDNPFDWTPIQLDEVPPEDDQ